MKNQKKTERKKYRRRGNGFLLTEAELAKKSGEEERTIRYWRQTGRIPAVAIGYRTFRYRLEDVLEALSKRTLKVRTF